MIRSASFRAAVAALTSSLALSTGCSPANPSAQSLLAPGGSGQADGCSGASCAGPGSGTCDDGIRNGDEVDVDCGGSRCTALGKRCADGEGCIVPGDCESSSCQGATCKPPTCMDGVRNGNEVDVDCGAACGADRLCPAGRHCGSNSDCTTGICN